MPQVVCYFGLRIRRELRNNVEPRQWIKHSTLDCSHQGSTFIKLKPNPAPTFELDAQVEEPPGLGLVAATSDLQAVSFPNRRVGIHSVARVG